MTNTIQPSTRLVTVVGGSFGYGTYVVTFAQPVNNVSTAEYPAHFALSASAGTPVDPMTDQTGQALLAAIQALTAALTGTVGIDAGSS